MIYTVTLNPSLDYAMEFDKIDNNNVNRSKKESVYVGGKGINVSCVLSALNIENKALGFVAGFTGREIQRILNENRIQTDFVELKEGHSRINVKVLHNDSTTELNANGPIVSDDDVDKLYDKIIMLTNDDYLVLAGSSAKSLPADIYAKMCSIASDRGAKIILDTTGSNLLNALKFRPFLIKPNHIELSELVGRKLSSREDIIVAAKELINLGARNVLVSMGAKGAVLVKEDGSHIYREAIKVEVINTVGAGDSMLAGFIYGYCVEHDYEYALMMGTVCGAATVSTLSVADRKMIDKTMSFTKK